MTHTPGPWEVRWPSRWIVSPAGDAELGNWLVAKDVRWDGDARLIAAAPDLLEALKDGLAMFGQDAIEDDDVISIERIFRAAIAKAEGKQP